MFIGWADRGMRSWLIVPRISALCFQRRHLIGLRVIHRRDECLSLRAIYYTFLRMNIQEIPKALRRRSMSSHGINSAALTKD